VQPWGTRAPATADHRRALPNKVSAHQAHLVSPCKCGRSKRRRRVRTTSSRHARDDAWRHGPLARAKKVKPFVRRFFGQTAWRPRRCKALRVYPHRGSTVCPQALCTSKKTWRKFRQPTCAPCAARPAARYPQIDASVVHMPCAQLQRIEIARRKCLTSARQRRGAHLRMRPHASCTQRATQTTHSCASRQLQRGMQGVMGLQSLPRRRCRRRRFVSTRFDVARRRAVAASTRHGAPKEQHHNAHEVSAFVR